MRIRIIHGGQTGVDRGAHFGALDAGFAIGGWMPDDSRDEYGLIPADVARYLERSTCGNRGRTIQNVGSADAVIVLVANSIEPYASPGTMLTLRECRRQVSPRLLIGYENERPFSEWSSAAREWVDTIIGRSDREEFRLMVAGPRISRWPAGERHARELVASLA